MSPTEFLGRVLAALFEPVTPLLALTFVAALFLRELRSYWVIAGYFVLITIHGSLGYFYLIDQIPAFYIGFRAVELTLMGVVAWQLGRRSFISYPSLAAFATRWLWYLLPVCVILAFITMLTDPDVSFDRSPALQLTFAIERSIKSAILGFLIAVAVFAGWFPVRMKQNSARLLIGFVVLQACDWLVLLASNTRWQWSSWGAFWKIFVSAEVLLYWLFALKPAGEKAVAATVPRWSPQRMEALTGQLEEIQSQLARRGY